MILKERKKTLVVKEKFLYFKKIIGKNVQEEGRRKNALKNMSH